MNIDELLAQMRIHAKHVSPFGVKASEAIFTEIDFIEANRAGFDKAQALADLVPGLVRKLADTADQLSHSQRRTLAYEVMQETLAEARKIMEEPNEQTDSDT